MQIQFNFINENQYLEEDFIVSSSNYAAIRHIDEWPEWGTALYHNINYIYGAGKCGKTHLAHIWQRKSAAHFLSLNDIKSVSFDHLNHPCYVLDDIEIFLGNNNNLLHLFNILVEQKKSLLITAKTPPQQLPIELADLKSRLNSLAIIEIQQPDDELLKTLLIKLFSDRNLRINIDVINYILARTQRSFSELNKIVELVDRISLAEKRNITVKLIRNLYPALQ